MPDQITELRCPTCAKLLASFSDDFDGAISVWCGRCKEDRGYPALALVPDTRISCACRKWLACGVVTRGSFRTICKRDRVLAVVMPLGTLLAEESRSSLPRTFRAPIDLRPMADRERALVTMIEERWQVLRKDRVRRNVELAVGIRFDVFNRDGFRCVYCGRSPQHGVYLEADHLVPRSAGGPDTMANLVTACWDCNRGKAAKVLTGVPLGDYIP